VALGGGSHSPDYPLVFAGVIQLVECQLPKLDVAGSSPVARSRKCKQVNELAMVFAVASAFELTAAWPFFALAPGRMISQRS
jgi:hypothetical protein